MLKNSVVANYLSQSIELVRSLSIKMSICAELLNNHVISKHGVDAVGTDPKTWKYYMNLAGLYHPTDTVMTVTSLDTLQEIEFTKDTLEVHSNTKEGYAYGTRLYHVLAERYPDQNDLIKGILFPADLDHAVSAEDGTIVSWNPDLVEEQEYTLISSIEQHIKRHNRRLFTPTFTVTDEYYMMSYMHIVNLGLILKVLSKRHSAHLTHEAHSFFIKSFLASHGGLDRHYPYMTLRQAMYLYKNIRYLVRNSGKTEQFEELVARIMTERAIPLVDYSIRQTSEFDDDLYVKPLVRANPINQQSNTSEPTFQEVDRLLRKEEKVTYGTERFYQANEANVLNRIKNHNTAVTQTKDLESSMVDFADSLDDTQEDIVMRHWGYMANNGMYTAIIRFRDVKNGEEYALTAFDAFVYMYYISLRVSGNTSNDIPPVYSIKRARHPKPNVKELMSVAPKERTHLESVATTLVNGMPELTNTPSTSSFYRLMKRIYDQHVQQWLTLGNTHDMFDHGYVANMILRLYVDETYRFNTQHTSFDTFLASNNLPTYNYSESEGTRMLAAIYKAGSGINEDAVVRASDVLNAMVSIMTQLSSYSIQFMQDINQNSLIPVDWKATRMSGDIDLLPETEAHIRDSIKLMDYNGEAETLAVINSPYTEVLAATAELATQDVSIEFTSSDLFLGMLEATYAVTNHISQLDLTIEPLE